LVLFIILIYTANNLYYAHYVSPNQVEEARKIDDQFWDKSYENIQIKNKYKLLIITTNGGEWAESKYLASGAKNLGWDSKIIFYTTNGHEDEILKYDPDFIIFPIGIDYHISQAIVSHRSKKFGIYYFPINTHIKDLNFENPQNDLFPTELYVFDESLKPNIKFSKMIRHSDALLITDKGIKIIEDYFTSIHRKFYGIRVVPSVNDNSLIPSKPQHISLIGLPMKDENRGSDKFRNMLKMLTQDKILKTYGLESGFWFIPSSYQGYIEDANDIIATLNKNGISLIVHRMEHFENSAPTNRIMEAAAANSLVICDKNPFVIEHFGDSVLYFDINIDSEAMYKQVRGHYDWAQANPEEAKKLANRAHEIFKEKFTSEKDLIRIAKVYEKMLEDEKKMNLEFPYKP